MRKNKTSRNKYLLDQRNKRRAFLIEMLGGGCIVCGCLENIEFHHKNKKTKVNSISRMLNGNFNSLIEEAKKCELRCRKHHLAIHKSIANHGTIQRYWRGCRCRRCKIAKRPYTRESMRKYRLKLRGQKWTSMRTSM